MTVTTNTPRRTYRERREARAARLREWASKRDARAEQAATATDAVAAAIPSGQPILLGHHSQRRAERDRDRIDRGVRRTIEHTEKAREFTRRADKIEAAAEARKGLIQKAKSGGTPNRAPIGYLNIRKMIEGRKIRTVEIDPERAPHVR
jgi:Domain of unknown function (DUF3560)